MTLTQPSLSIIIMFSFIFVLARSPASRLALALKSPASRLALALKSPASQLLEY